MNILQLPACECWTDYLQLANSKAVITTKYEFSSGSSHLVIFQVLSKMEMAGGYNIRESFIRQDNQHFCRVVHLHLDLVGILQ